MRYGFSQCISPYREDSCDLPLYPSVSVSWWSSFFWILLCLLSLTVTIAWFHKKKKTLKTKNGLFYGIYTSRYGPLTRTVIIMENKGFIMMCNGIESEIHNIIIIFFCKKKPALIRPELYKHILTPRIRKLLVFEYTTLIDGEIIATAYTNYYVIWTVNFFFKLVEMPNLIHRTLYRAWKTLAEVTVNV